MQLSLKRLTLLAPRELEDALVAAMLAMQPDVPSFTTTPASGHGEPFVAARIEEQVRGRVDRAMLWLVLPTEDVERVLTTLRERVPSPDIIWWLEPVDAMGRLA